MTAKITQADVDRAYNICWWLLIGGFIAAMFASWLCVPLWIAAFLESRLAMFGEAWLKKHGED